jgi:hypothetical protein
MNLSKQVREALDAVRRDGDVHLLALILMRWPQVTGTEEQRLLHEIGRALSPVHWTKRKRLVESKKSRRTLEYERRSEIINNAMIDARENGVKVENAYSIVVAKLAEQGIDVKAATVKAAWANAKRKPVTRFPRVNKRK